MSNHLTEDGAAIGIDLAKKVFYLHGVDCHGKVVLRRQSHRTPDAWASSQWFHLRQHQAQWHDAMPLTVIRVKV